MAEKNQPTEQLLDYIYSWETPVESDFFGDKEKEKLDKEEKKLKKTQDYLTAVANNPGLGSQLDRDIAMGMIYSQGETNKVLARRRALEQAGERTFPEISLVSPKGQRIIMSESCADGLGFITDGYILPDEMEDLASILKSEGLSDDKIARAKDAINLYGAILLQRGAFEALYDLLEEVAETRKPDFTEKDHQFEEVKQTFEGEHGASLEAVKAAMTIPVPPKATPLEDNAFAKELKREVETTELSEDQVKDASEYNNLAPLPSELTVPMKPGRSTPPTMGLKTLLDIRGVDDLKKIQTDHLRQGELSEQISIIKSKIMTVAKSHKMLPFYTVAAFEESPLYKTYLSIGSSLISDANPDRAQAYRAATAKSTTETLTLREFEAIADLRKQIEQL